MSDTVRADVPLVIVGCDFRIASSVFREQLVMLPEQRRSLFEAIRKTDPEAGLVVLETCNRVEWIVSAGAPDWMASLLSARMVEKWRRRAGHGVFPEPYRFTRLDAVRHLLRVVVGLESLALGEAQIAGQFQKALSVAREEGTTSIVLNGLGSAAGRIARTAQRLGVRANGHHGIHGMVVQAIRKRFAGFQNPLTVAVAGMGAIGRKTATLVESVLGCRVIRYNRTIHPSREGIWRPLSEIIRGSPEKRRDLFRSWDVLVVATGSFEPLFHLNHLADPERSAPLLLVDIGIPRQVSGTDDAVPGVVYHDVDDLAAYRSSVRNEGDRAALEAELKAETSRFRRFCLARDMSALLETIRLHRRDYIEEKIPKIIRERMAGVDPESMKTAETMMKQVIREYANDVFNSIHMALEDYRGADR